MKKIGMLLALLAGALLAAQAQAQSPGQFYIGIGGGSVSTKGASPYTDTQDDDRAPGGKLYFGSMGEQFGWELGGYFFGDYDVNFGGQKIAQSTASALAMSGVMATELGGGYTFHARLGLAITQFEIECVNAAFCGLGTPPLATTKQRGNSGVFGVGVGARLSRNILVRFDYEHFGNVHMAVSNGEYKDSWDMFNVSLQLGF